MIKLNPATVKYFLIMSNFITNKVEGNSLTPAEWNQLQDINNFISSAGLTADINDLNQIAKSIANYSAISNYYNDNGTVNNYTLSAINNYKSPTGYIAGMIIRFITVNANTTTTPIVNVAEPLLTGLAFLIPTQVSFIVIVSLRPL